MTIFRKNHGRLLGWIAFVVFALVARAGHGGDPDLVWYTIHTEHFNIHFHQGLERTARQTASLAEEVHEELTAIFGWEVDGPTEVVLTDPTDSANGMAMAWVRPMMRLYATGPTIDSALAYHDHWLRTLITHEYTHVIHLQMHGGLAKVINAIFGDVYLPNQMQPRWFIEGLAVMQETHRTTAGRSRSAAFKMTVRIDALEGRLLSLGEVSNPTVQFPRGHDDYIYGALFMDYLRDRFGEEKIVAICHEYGSELIPYGINRIFKRILGVDLVTVYDDWLAEVRAEAEATRDRLAEQGLSETTRLTTDGESKGRPVFTPDGGAVVLGVANGEDRSGIFEVPIDGSPRRRLVLAGAGSPPSLDRNGRMFYTRTAPFKNAYHFHDVFVLERAGAEPRRLTHGLRAREAAISPRGDCLALTLNEIGTTRLMLADERGNIERTLIDSAANDQVYDPAWSPDGGSLAVVLRRGHQVDLALVDADTGELRRLTDDRALESAPTFDPSGRYVVFSSDRSGISNVYAYDLAEDRLRQLTNVIGGATAPAVSPDGRRLAFLDYSTIGWDLHLLPFTPDEAPLADAVDLPVAAPPLPPRATPAPSTAEVEHYNPLPSLLPRYWMLGFSAAGAQPVLQAVTSMSDAVGHHAIGVQFDYGFSEQALSSSVGYSYRGLGPAFSVGFSRSMGVRESGYIVGGEDQSWIQERIKGSLTISAPIYGVDRNHGLSLSYSVTHARMKDEAELDLDPEGELPDIPDQYFRAGLSLGWSFSDAVSSPFGISPHKGRRLSASVSIYHPALGGDQKLATFRYAWTEYLGAPWLEHHVFALRLAGAALVSDPPEQASYVVGGYAEQNIIDALWNSHPAGLAALRGYPYGAFRGDQYHAARLEYRFPIWWTEAAYKTLPLFFRKVHGAVFTDNMLITYDALDRDDLKSSLGAELVWGFYFGYYMPITLRTGYAYGFMDQGTHEVIVIIGGTF